MNHVWRLALAVPFAVGLVACNKDAPRVPTPVALLETPSPPGRLLIPVELPEPAPPEPEVVEAPAPAPAPARPNPTATAKPPEKPATPANGAAPPPVLQTTPDTSTARRTTEQLIGSAQQSLLRVNYRDLDSNARQQYDLARTFIRQAEAALGNRNYLYAETLAKRAASVAALLVKG